MKLGIILLGFLATSIQSLTIAPADKQTSNKLPSNYNKNDARACRKQGGRYRKDGLVGNYLCIKSYKDAFKKCTASTECQGGCIVQDQYNPQGICKPNSSPFGCFATIQQWNQSHAIICRD